MVGCGSDMGNVGGEELPQVLLGRGSKDRGIHPDLDGRQSVGTRVVFRNKVELVTLEGVQEHCVCACTEGEAEEVGR